MVVDHGRVIAEGTPAQLKADLGTSVVSVTLGDRRAMGRAAELLTPFSEKPPIVEDLVVELTVDDGPKAGAEVLRTLDAARIAIAGLALREPSLDDVFLSLTGHRTEDRRRTEGDGRRSPSGAWASAAHARRGRREGCRMTTTAIPAPADASASRVRATACAGLLADIATSPGATCWRSPGSPEALFFSTLQPIMFVLLFRYVFGGAIHVPGGHYVDYLMPGIFVQTVLFGAMSTAVGLSEDLHKGLIERFRALPMAAPAVLAGRTTADVVRNVFVVTLIIDRGRLRRGLPHRDQRRRCSCAGSC